MSTVKHIIRRIQNMMITEIQLGIAALILVFTVLGTAIGKEGTVLFMTLAAFGFFYEGITLLGSVFMLSQTVIYGIIVALCLCALFAAIKQASCICRDNSCTIEQHEA
jgi:hypothetical protein